MVLIVVIYLVGITHAVIASVSLSFGHDGCALFFGLISIGTFVCTAGMMVADLLINYLKEAKDTN